MLFAALEWSKVIVFAIGLFSVNIMVGIISYKLGFHEGKNSQNAK